MSILTAGSDYVARTVRVNFGPSPSGNTVNCPQVEFIDDGVNEPDEVLFVDLSDPQGGCSISTPSSIVIISGEYHAPPTHTTP